MILYVNVLGSAVKLRILNKCYSFLIVSFE